MFYIIGLGNPGSEYESTRHNTGRIVLEVFRKMAKLPELSIDKKRNALISDGKVGKEKILLVFPQTFMNKSGEAVRGLIKSKKDAERLVIIHDDLDIPFGSYKISFNKSSGGHRGVESIIKEVKTEAFVRVRVGISALTPKGVVKKPKGEVAVEKLILGKFTSDQLATLKKLAKNIAEGITVLIIEGRDKAMGQYHS